MTFNSILFERTEDRIKKETNLLIKDNCIKVRHYESEIDYSASVEETFAKFKQGAVKDYRDGKKTLP